MTTLGNFSSLIEIQTLVIEENPYLTSLGRFPKGILIEIIKIAGNAKLKDFDSLLDFGALVGTVSINTSHCIDRKIKEHLEDIFVLDSNHSARSISDRLSFLSDSNCPVF